MQKRKVIRTTLGDLIVTVTDEVRLLARDPWSLYRAVSWILSDLLTHRQTHKRSRQKHLRRFANAL
jgi:hypothetical protein